ncbi:MAG TPA: UDP-N-acetylglucosamine 2-epimerase (non-hydrolyzing) [Gammaproteobacteria bacterium]|nr:UDP-N-acetylglucosamine 2-epimerase (non-hydrolyzing) [Gammaproteobacteria bacterium]
MNYQFNIDVIAGARPNFMKVAALFAVADRFPQFNLRLIHTGQHYDSSMSDVFFQDLGLPQPVSHFNVGSGSHARQTGAILSHYEDWTESQRPDLCIVVGDVNSTIACAMVAAKAGVPVAHVEAGLRSFDRTMPEEINRLLTDSISTLLFASEPDAVMNLSREGYASDAIHLVGQVMVDTLLNSLPKAEALQVWKDYGADRGDYAMVTLHRPANVDDREQLATVCAQLLWLADRLPIIFPVHPRTRGNLDRFGLRCLLEEHDDIQLCDPLSYLQSLSLMSAATMVVTDSGGLQEETTALGVPCLTLRENTERPVTVIEGSNHLICNDWQRFQQLVNYYLELDQDRIAGQVPYWDGKSAQRILSVCADYLAQQQPLDNCA